MNNTKSEGKQMKNQSGALNRKSLAVLLVVAIAIAVAAAALVGSRPGKEAFVKPPAEIEDYLFWEARELAEFKLTGADSKTLGLNDLKGKWSFIFFGYIHCPDVCPLTMGVLGKAFKLIEQDPTAHREVQGVFVSVDPKRDTPELVKEYASYFGDKFIGVTGEDAQLEAFSRQMSALYTIHPKDPKSSGDDYQVTHNSTVFLIDPQGRLYGRFPPPQLPNEIAGVFLKIRMFYNERVKK
jgi:protein SCO1/2